MVCSCDCSAALQPQPHHWTLQLPSLQSRHRENFTRQSSIISSIISWNSTGSSSAPFWSFFTLSSLSLVQPFHLWSLLLPSITLIRLITLRLLQPWAWENMSAGGDQWTTSKGWRSTATSPAENPGDSAAIPLHFSSDYAALLCSCLWFECRLLLMSWPAPCTRR